MNIVLIVLFALIYRIDSHSEHGSSHTQPPGGQQHMTRKVEDYVHDMDHIRHDLEGLINKPKEQLTEEEQNFLYFKLHDINNDNLLDGLELVAAFHHVHDEYVSTNNATIEEHPSHHERQSDEQYAEIIDNMLKTEDRNGDGFISYEEFKLSLQPITHS